MFSLSKILSFILDKDNQRFILFVALAGALVFGVTQCDAKKEAKREITKQKNNIDALRDSVNFYDNKAGELTAKIQAFQTDKNQLKTLNEDLSRELEKERDKVEQITKINAELRSDTTETDTTSQTKVDINQWRFNWSVEKSGDGWHKVLEGYTHFHLNDQGVPYDPNTYITKDRLLLQLVTGVTTQNGKKEIFVRSTYPGLTVTNLQGAVLEDRPELASPSRFGIGLSLGGAWAGDRFSPYIGIGINYNLIRF